MKKFTSEIKSVIQTRTRNTINLQNRKNIQRTMPEIY